MKEILKLQAEVCKSLANAKRLEIIYALKDGEKGAGELAAELGLAKSNVSQHLAVLRGCGILRSRRDGKNVYYSIASPKLVEACALMRQFMAESLEATKKVFEKAEKKARGKGA